MTSLHRRNGKRRTVAIVAATFVSALGVSAGAAFADAPPVMCDGLVATIVGTNGPDVLTGTPDADVIAGLAGEDVIAGGLGDDVICGGPGGDRISGQGDDDRLFGQQGSDLLDGGEGGCCIVPTNTGDDFLSGGTENDELHTSDFSTAASTLHGDEGDDELFIWSGASAFGDEGDDELNQFSRNSILDGGEGNDVLVDMDDFGLTNETITLLGGLGDDTLRAEDATSDSTLNGESGVDTCAGGDVTGGCEA